MCSTQVARTSPLSASHFSQAKPNKSEEEEEEAAEVNEVQKRKRVRHVASAMSCARSSALVRCVDT